MFFLTNLDKRRAYIYAQIFFFKKGRKIMLHQALIPVRQFSQRCYIENKNQQKMEVLVNRFCR